MQTTPDVGAIVGDSDRNYFGIINAEDGFRYMVNFTSSILAHASAGE